MELSTFWKASIFLTVLGSAYSGIKYYRNVEQAKIDVVALKLQLNDTQSIYDSQKAEWTSYEVVKTKATEAVAKTASLKQQKEDLDKRIQAAELQFKNLAASAREAVDKVRTDAASLTIPELKLVDGKILKDARLRKIESSQISFTHSDGIGSVPFNQLPPGILERLDTGTSSITNDIAAVEADIFAGITRVAGVTLKCPVPLSEKPYPVNLPVVTEAKRFEGKTSDEMEISVACIRYVKGTVIDLEAAAAGSIKSIASLEGMSNPQHQLRDVKISSFPGKRSSFSAKRFGGEMFAESLFIFNGEKMWLIQVLFSNKSKGATPVAESILKSVQVEPGV